MLNKTPVYDVRFFWFTVKSIEIGVFAKCCYFSLTEVTGIRKIHSFLTIDKHAEDGREVSFWYKYSKIHYHKGNKKWGYQIEFRKKATDLKQKKIGNK